MNVSIQLSSWKIIEKDGRKNIAGSYKVVMGKTELSKTDFNEGYSSTTISFPVSLIEKVEALDKEVAEALTKNFTGE